ncbi:fibronectin type III domain-containing protein [Pseudomonas sp. A-R-19]|uniref:fibronectin type III domain-containing protein n=1 Tax=Pseudomonas sp. A-R-19 TaxID=2832403 RepID=UPI001CBB3BCC|nr:fibronectin type III domain-containing protein [Pseudomonas sp. A-R-19]
MNKPNFDDSALSHKVVSTTRNSIELSWENREVLVKYILTSAGEGSGRVIYEGPATVFTHGALRSNTEYSYFIVGVNAEGKRTKPALILTRTAVRVIPQAPDFFQAYNQTPNSVSFFWNDGVVDGGRRTYEIRRDGELLDTPSAPPYTDTRPLEGRDHVYCIRTVDDEFYKSEPHCIVVNFPDFTAPTNPENLRTSNVGVIFGWEKSYDSSGTVEYEIDLDGDRLGTTTETEFAIAGLDSGRQYVLGVTAFDKSGHHSDRVTIQYPGQGVPPQRK